MKLTGTKILIGVLVFAYSAAWQVNEASRWQIFPDTKKLLTRKL